MNVVSNRWWEREREREKKRELRCTLSATIIFILALIDVKINVYYGHRYVYYPSALSDRLFYPVRNQGKIEDIRYFNAARTLLRKICAVEYAGSATTSGLHKERSRLITRRPCDVGFIVGFISARVMHIHDGVAKVRRNNCSSIAKLYTQVRI